MITFKETDVDLINQLVNELLEGPETFNQKREILAIHKILCNLDLLQEKNWDTLTLYLIEVGLRPLLTQFFYLGMKFMAARKDLNELDKLFKEQD